MSDGGLAAADGLERRRLTPIGVGVSVVLVVIAFVLAIQGDDDGDAWAVDAPPRLLDVTDLAPLEDSLGHALYWVGERPPDALEVTKEADGSVYLRYLPPGVSAGDPRPRFLTVGTYPVADAVGALRRTATEAGVELEEGAGGAAILPNPSSDGSAYLAYPGADLQIEVYDPAPGRALELIRSGAIRPVG